MSKRDRSSSAARRRDSGRRALALGAVAAAATAGFVALNAAVVRRETAEVDEAARKAVAADPDSTTHEAAEAVKKVGKWYTYIPTAMVASAGVLAAPGERDWRSRGVGVGAVMLASAVATALNPTFDKVLPQPPAPPGHPDPNKPVFPSGHAFGPSAVSLAAAYVASREGIAHPAVAFPVAAVVPLLTAGPRMLVQKHWLSDVAGGVLGGIAVAAACLAGYEAARG
ncbi:MAG TPA: phosphatase PAP2 family protein [Longimicrobium sp.]|nr:phosphatase PAP2 family protein [Longimicrobium sp.]